MSENNLTVQIFRPSVISTTSHRTCLVTNEVAHISHLESDITDRGDNHQEKNTPHPKTHFAEGKHAHPMVRVKSRTRT